MILKHLSDGCIFLFEYKGMDCFKYWYNIDNRKFKVRARSRFEIVDTILHIKRKA